MKQAIFFFLLLLNFFVGQHSLLAKDSLSIQSSEQIAKIEKAYFEIWMDKQVLLRIKQNTHLNKLYQEKEFNIQIQDSTKYAELLANINFLKQIDRGEPVVLINDTLFKIYKAAGGFNRVEVAKNISNKIIEIGEIRDFNPDSITMIAQLNGSYSYEYAGENLFTLRLIELAVINPENPHQAAQFILVILRRKLLDYNNLSDFSVLIKKIGIGLAIILGIIFLLLFLNRQFTKLKKYSLENEALFIEKIGLRNDQGLLKRLVIESLQKTILLVQVVLFGFIIYLGLPALFNVFPKTKFITTTLLGWIIEPSWQIYKSIIQFIPDLVTILVIYYFTRFTIRLLKFFYNEIERGRLIIKGFHKEFAKPTFQIVQFLVYAFMLVVIFPYLPGSNSPAFKGVSVFLGVLFSLGSSSALSNIMAGLVLTYMRPFKVGDRIKIGDCTGDVMEKTILVTKIKTIKNEEITLPNATVLNAQTLNYSMFAQTEGLILHSTVTIGYDVPWNKMHAVLIEAASITKYINKTPAPFVLQTSLDDFYVSYQINAYTNEANKQISIYSDLHQNIQDCCAKAGIEIMSPHYNSLRDGNQSTIPKTEG